MSSDKTEVTLYDALEVSPRASALVIKAAYRCLAQVNHPDKNSGSAAASERLAQINHAYSVLSDPDKRRRYDQTIERHDHLVDRRGKGMHTGGRPRPVVDEPLVSRAFVFRPLT
ncbi:MAG: J domain-containing protein [Rhodoferax sp.]|uniref:J domain-containing protein n=1 Tax=Rhodoferax sp. TaxID=50421 RepID=UPI00178E753B|nr:J domain-containing protein [Rhodoferax sp.]NMM13879.1 J domain-containing protein [Rhodoferax sp.]